MFVAGNHPLLSSLSPVGTACFSRHAAPLELEEERMRFFGCYKHAAPTELRLLLHSIPLLSQQR